jgi:hypothetical protein
MKTSIWLPDDLVEPWKATGVSLAELVRRGIDAPIPGSPPDAVALRAIVREELAVGVDEVRRAVREEIARVSGEH